MNRLPVRLHFIFTFHITYYNLKPEIIEQQQQAKGIYT